MGSKPKPPKAAPVSAPAMQSSLDIKRTQERERKLLRRRFGFSRTRRASQDRPTLG